MRSASNFQGDSASGHHGPSASEASGIYVYADNTVIDGINMTVTNIPGGNSRGTQRPDLVPGPAQVRALLEWVRRARTDGRLPVPELSEEGFLGWRFEGVVRPYLCQCRAGTEVAGIKADGTIGACPELGPAFDQGHVDRDRFRDVWEQRYRDLRDRSWTRAAGPCADCEHWSWCRGGAMHLYERPGAPFLRCLYLQCKEAESGAGGGG